MKIAILEDDMAQLEYIGKLVKAWGEKEKVQLWVDMFKNSGELFMHYSPGVYDLFLLDIQMSGGSGMDAAKEIRRQNDDGSIIFITAVKDYVFEGYNVGAYRYLLKPVDREELYECIKSLQGKISEELKICFETEEGTIALRAKDIFYAEAYSHKTIIALSDKKYIVSENITGVFQRLPHSFEKCHRSYAVNLAHVSSVMKDEITLDNGEKVPLSRRARGDFNKKFIAFYRGAGNGTE